ncbi:GNAT family N-acetyltransferase [Alicyclobacillus fastidiosus]|uniref:GNAT family protein n=1 Tax=Alicyclobacillus fastidiosus TaxID=392011 RepID=A0ABV5ABJ6_9BACL|nr:GNAT family protein [Alicyclobacillus fastidiosus]WEH10398.1 GNAT family protein [Alicyclobacillus fastidiosus]
MSDDLHKAQLRFQLANTTEFTSLYQTARHDEGWPATLGNLPLCRRFVADWSARNALCAGRLELIQVAQGGSAIGFTTVATVDATFAPNGVQAVEAGTYLVPASRGRGYNAEVKGHQRRLAKEVYGAKCLVFVVEEHNVAAHKAMDNLPWPTTQVTMSMTRDSWYRFLRRRVWEEQRTSVLYVQEL